MTTVRQQDSVSSLSMVELFRLEAEIHMATLEQGLSTLERDPQAMGELQKLMRAAHSLKGAARMVEYHEAVEVAHDLEEQFLAAQQAQSTAAVIEGMDVLKREVQRLKQLAYPESATTSSTITQEMLERLEAPLGHLIRNALEHGIESPAERTAVGKPHIGCIRIEAERDGDQLNISVTDDGRGIDPEAIRQTVIARRLTASDIAQALTDAELYEFLLLPGFSLTKDGQPILGRGLGLDGLRVMQQELGGTVTMTSKAGRGTNIHLRLPLTRPIPTARSTNRDSAHAGHYMHQVSSDSPTTHAAHAAHAARVLVVDDSITVREKERQLLLHEGYAVDVAVDGVAGWEALQAGEYDLVVTDVDMPRLDGIGLTQLIRREATRPHIPIVVVSYKDRAEDRQRGIDAGASCYLTKACFLDNTFVETVATLLQETSSLHATPSLNGAPEHVH